MELLSEVWSEIGVGMSDWKQIDNLPYSVNKNGDVRNDRTGKILKPVTVSGGYLQARLSDEKMLIKRYGLSAICVVRRKGTTV